MGILFGRGWDGETPRFRRLIVARHGETEWNVRHVWQGWRDVALTSRGIAQAHALAERLVSENIGRVVSSDLVRARATAEIVAERIGLAVTATPDLREIDVGSWEEQTTPQITEQNPEIAAAVERGEDPPRGGGETVAALRTRVVRAFHRATEGSSVDTLALIAHGGTAKCLLGYLLGIPLGATGRLSSGANASYSIVEFRPDGPCAVALNVADHVRGI